jgi:diguanylate cyclase (GGDEF)-like protein/PAS domain S-box-containing protein
VLVARLGSRSIAAAARKHVSDFFYNAITSSSISLRNLLSTRRFLTVITKSKEMRRIVAPLSTLSFKLGAVKMSISIGDFWSQARSAQFFTKTLGRSAFLLFSIITLITVSCAAYNYYLFTKERTAARHWADKEQEATRLTIELVALQKQAEIDFIELQRGFSGSKAIDLRGDAPVAREYSDRLRRNVDLALNAARSLGSVEITDSISEIRSRLPEFFDASEEMARADMEQDALARGATARFDQMAHDLKQKIATMGDALNATIERNMSLSNDVNANIDQLRDYGTTVALISVVVVIVTGAMGVMITFFEVIQPLTWITFVFKELAHGRPNWHTYEVSRPDEIGDLARVYAEFRQITIERMEALNKVAEQQVVMEAEERQLKLLAERFDAALRNMHLGLVMVDRDQQLLVHNPKIVELLGVSADDVWIGRAMKEILQRAAELEGLSDENLKRLLAAFSKLWSISGKENLLIETKSGRVLEFAFQPMAESGSLIIVEDITEKSSAQAAVHRLAYFDSLTELPNRRAFFDGVERALDETGPENELFALLFVDLDHFKQINDTQGHGAGDELLRGVASRLMSLVRKGDIVARLGGDEFVILQRDVRRVKDISSLAQRIVDCFREPLIVAGQEVCIGASVGVARAPRDGQDRDTLMRNADTALYRAKASGRNTWRFFKPAMHAEIVARADLERDLRQAVAEKALEVHFQPILHVEGEKISAFEALLRWRHPERGMVPPAEFIPLAEETGLIVEMGEFVIDRACQACANWPDHIRVAVNLSALQFKRGDLVASIENALSVSGLTAKRLELEITESILMQETDNVRSLLKRLHELGVTISLDDFGTGYSSLSYLHSFPLDRLKIDRSFLRKAVDSEQSLTLLHGMIRMSLDLKLGLIVEGVETQEQLHLVRNGCSLAEVQGFLFSPALPESQVAQFVASADGRRAA